MKNRYFNIKKDSQELNNFENVILPMINNAKFEDVEQKEKVISWSRDTFFNQWKRPNQ
tara:strand:+ start:51 stop:224 length:174 start_codon:yes stop_codon:yes gene_type:complete